MIIDNATDNGKDFEPDPFLDIDGEYEARLVGLAHIGLHENKKFDSDEFEEIQQAILMYELTEEETFVTRGEGEDAHQVPRTAFQFIKYSSHEKSGLFKLAKKLNSKAAWVEKKKGMIDVTKIIGLPSSLKFKFNGDKTKQNIKEVNSIPAKYQKDVPEAQASQFCYSVHSGAHIGVIGDVPAWILRRALEHALNADDFEQLEDIEAHLDALEKAKDEGTELEGDMPAKKSQKSDDKKPESSRSRRAAKQEEEKPEEQEPEKEEDKQEEDSGKSERRSRRSRRTETKPDMPDFEGMGGEACEDWLLENGKDEKFLDELSQKFPEDDKFDAALVEACKEVFNA